ncbi:MAG: hypothetical protein WAV67_15055 [Dokdonella sp.]
MATTSETKQNIKAGADETVNAASEVGATLKSGIDQTTSELRRLGNRLSANGANLEEELRDAGERFSDGFGKISTATSEQIRANPLAAAGIAFAAGYVLSRLFRSR